MPGLIKFGWIAFWQKRGWGNLLLLVIIALAIVAAGFVVRQFETGVSVMCGLTYYQRWGSVFLTLLIPAFSLLQGVSLLREEIESKTLVYVWTRPCGRLKPIVAKWTVACIVYSASAILALCVLYYGSMSVFGSQQELTKNLGYLGWDTVAVVFCVAGYLPLGLAFATFGKRANQAALFYFFFIDSLAILIPGELRKISLKVLIVALSASGSALIPNGGQGLFNVVNSRLDPVNEWEALLAWALIITACWAYIIVVFRVKELGAERVASQI